MENERCIGDQFQAQKSNPHNQKLEIKKLSDQLKQESKRKRKTQVALRCLKGIRHQDEEKATN
jgi:hypothetical protein